MKKLLILAAIAALTAGASGCRSCDWLWRGSSTNQNPCPPAAPVYSAPCCNPCDPCAGGGAPVAMPGPTG